ncbi:MAG: ABC transporter permease [Bacillota bacterium]
MIAKYVEVLKVTLQNRLAYVYDQIFRSLGMVIHIFIFIQLWRVTFRSVGSTIGGFTLPQMIWYLVLTETIITSAPRFNGRIDAEVRAGDVAYSLNRPYSYLFFQFASFLAEWLFLLPINFAAGAAVAWPLVGGIRWQPEAIPAALLAMLAGASIQFFQMATVALLAFWLEDTRGLWLLVERAQWLLGGLLLPVEAFPGVLRRIAEVLPFPHVVGGPARLAVDFSWQTLGSLALYQGVWLVVFVVTASTVFRLGVSRINVNGG